MANFVDISLPEMDAFLFPLRFRRNNNLTYRGRPIKEVVYERTLPGKPNHIVRVYTSINRFGQQRGRGRKVGKDAIRVQVLYRDDQGEVLLYQPKRVHRVANWKNNLQNRLDEIISADIKVVKDKRGQPMTLRTKGANKFWGSRDYPAYKETRRYESEQVTESDAPDNWRLVTIADTQTDSFGKGLQRQFDFSDYDGNPYDAVWELIEIIDDLNRDLKHTAHTQFSYNRVLITLYTDDVGNMTNQDYIWAEEFNDLYDYEDELIMMSERETKRVMVINTLDGKLHSIVKWMYYPDGSKNYEIVATPKPVRNSKDPHQIQRFYTALGVSSHIYDMNRQRFSAESYPSCYLCGLPAKIEVMTAVGMRNFCSNKCRGYYEGVDYGDYDSPKLEHRLKITNYNQGYLPDWGSDERESKLTIDCANCSLHVVEDIPQYADLYSDYRRGHRHTIKTWNEEYEDYDEEPCYNHDFIITRYLSNSETYDGIRLGEIAFRCRKCGYRDMIYADIPEGCPNTGRTKPTMSQIMGTTQTDRMRIP
jgi:pterin-4a-carbinolamine dehydratase